jgi:hypothetical protein
MRVIALLAVGGLAALAGCQTSGRAEVDTTARPSARAAAATDGYSMRYQAADDTEWAARADAAAPAGTIREGEVVMFDRAPDASLEWQAARRPDGTIVYVRPAAFRPAPGSR